MKFGDFIHKILAPFVKNTKYEKCDLCEERRLKWNSKSDKVVAWFNKVTCPCFWKGLFNK